MTRTMKAAVLHAKDDLRVEDGIEVPAPAAGQVLVKLAYSGICRSQLMELRGGRGEDRYLPHLLGHEGSGVVVEAGTGVTKVKAGDEVVLTWIKGEGLEAGGVRYRKGDMTVNAGAVTTLNEYAVVSENRCVKMPAGLPMDVAVLFGCALPTGAGIVMNEVRPEKGRSIAVFGLGGIGVSALIACRLYELDKVIAVDVEAAKLDLAREFGATHEIDASKEDPVAAVRRITDGKGVDYAVEAAGTTTTIEQAFDMLAHKSGLLVFASHPPSGEKIRLDPHSLISGRRIQGSWGGATRPDRDVSRLATLYTERRFPFDKLASHSYPLVDVNRAFDDLEARRVVRALIVIDPSLGSPGGKR